ncbi:molybdate ABC transporter permease subunit [Neiella sp. HB171785]|uniref:Molybdenum transport system permease n=1 Tax=Neiella litorisoli TaxID=2771431 RepID=A0A8J6QSG7_9GAMM|nr:molybdate ABC transporter permease subunit [Neiella litorisoli]MBD1391206.1 molybdate ABC transporter permease subunit [Neiella litorisoli]
MSGVDLSVVWLTLKLASVVTLLLLLIATPIAWWLSQTQSKFKPAVGAIFAIPLVLPPTVLGFYLLLLLGPNGPAGQLSAALGLGTLPFSFAGIAIACAVHSLPFVVQPLQNAFEAIGKRPLEVAATLRASPWDCFWHVVVPMARPGFFTAIVMGFCHSIGEFGVVLMIGGNIPGETRVLSVEIYNHVEAMEYGQAHWLAGGMVAFSFIALLAIYMINHRASQRGTL